MSKRKFYRINQYIQAEKVRVINADGKQAGILTIREALNKARKDRLDLVEVSSKSDPPVCKIVDFRKFIYQQKKKRQENYKKEKQIELKQIRIKPFIDEHDLQRIIQKVKKFLEEGNRVKFSILFRGREITKKDFGFQLFKKIEEKLAENAKIAQKAKFKGRILEMAVEPKNHGQK